MAFDSALGSRTQNALISVERFDELVLETHGADILPTVLGEKQTLIQHVTRFMDRQFYRGIQLWPELQRLEWPRRFSVTPSLHGDLTGPQEVDLEASPFDIEQRTAIITTVNSSTEFVVSGLAGDPDRFWDDFWNEGSMRNDNAGNAKNEVRRISDFVSSTGTITIGSAFSVLPVAGNTFRLVSRLPQVMEDAVFQLCIAVAREKTGYTETRRGRSKKKEPDLTRLVRKMLQKVIRTNFDVG